MSDDGEEQTTFGVSLLQDSTPIGDCTFEIYDTSQSCLLTFRYEGRMLTSQKPDFFEAFCEIRRELEKEKIVPYCYGAALNCFPSGMGRDMGSGLSVFELTLGERGKMKNLRFLFDAAPGLNVVSVDEQEAYYDKWLASLNLWQPQSGSKSIARDVVELFFWILCLILVAYVAYLVLEHMQLPK